MKVGSIGNVAFNVDSKNAAILSDYERSVKANYTTHSLIGQTGVLEYTGNDPTEISFKVTLSAYLGINPGRSLDALEALALKGQKVQLTLGTKIIGERWAVESVDSRSIYQDRDGDTTAYEVTLKLKECVTPRIDTSNAGYYLAEGNSGWQKRNGVWYYYENGVLQTGWKLVGGLWYYMNESGIMQTGWILLGGIWYYLNPSGDMAIGWVWWNNNWYYCNDSGAMVTGWVYWNEGWYYCSASGAMVTGEQVIDGKTYHFDDSGKCLDPYG